MRYQYLLITIIFICAFTNCNSQILKAVVSKRDSIISLTANIRRDYRIFGYKKPDTISKKMILFSVFTNDVENNLFKCPYGSYYQTSSMQNMKIKFLTKNGLFIKAAIRKDNATSEIIYFLKKWIDFEK